MIVAIVAIAHLHHHRSKFAVAQERAGVFGTNYLPRDLSHKFTGGPLPLVVV